MKYDIITFGSAARDIFLKARQFLISGFRFDYIKKKILLPYGLKVDIEKIHFHSGGGGTNTAATFTSQGLKTAYCGVIGRDLEGEAVLREIKEKGIEVGFVFKTDKKATNSSIIFSTPKERTILVYKGASQTLNEKQIPWSKIKNTEWFYLAPLSGKLFKLFGKLVDFAKDNQIKIMVNPGSSQLELSTKILKPIFQKIDILLLNQEEGQILIRDPSLRGERLIRKIKRIFPGILIITDGEGEVLIADGKFLYSALPLKIEVLDKTGAGDAFGAGFLSEYIRSKGNIVTSTQLAIANSASCIRKWGAKEGILKKNQKFRKVKVTKKRLTQKNENS
jgi:sugar/nucleoside kinase (ribokinase family)